jgi:CubicO group peptidase (beta-lactamase class C family)
MTQSDRYLSLLVLIALTAVTGCDRPSHAPSEAGLEVDPRVQRVTEGLRPPVTLDGERPETHALQQRMEELNVPAASVAVIDGYQVVWSRAWGIADRGTGRPATMDTAFHAASMAKTVAAVAALQLVAEGRLDLDQPVNEQLRSWAIPKTDQTLERPVTPRMLLGHRAGLPRGYFELPPDGPIPEMAAMLAGDDPNRRAQVVRLPDSGYTYSNIGYGVLQLLLEDVTGMPYAELVRSRLFEPLGMAATVCDPANGAEVAAGHEANGTPIEEIGLVPPAVGGLWSSAEDYARLVAALLRAWRGDQGAVLPRQLVNEMFDPDVEGYGLGVYVTGQGDATSIQHSGGYTGFRCRFMAFPATGQGAVVMANSDHGVSIVAETLAAIGAEYGWPGHPLDARTVEPDPVRLATMEGAYRCVDAPQFLLRVAVEGTELKTQVNQYPPISYRSVAEDLFLDPNRGRTIAFRRDSDGRIVGLVTNRAGFADGYFALEANHHAGGH